MGSVDIAMRSFLLLAIALLHLSYCCKEDYYANCADIASWICSRHPDKCETTCGCKEEELAPEEEAEEELEVPPVEADCENLCDAEACQDEIRRGDCQAGCNMCKL